MRPFRRLRRPDGGPQNTTLQSWNRQIQLHEGGDGAGPCYPWANQKTPTRPSCSCKTHRRQHQYSTRKLCWEVEQGINPDASGLIPPGFEPFPEVGNSRSGWNRNWWHREWTFLRDDNSQAMRPRPLNRRCHWRVIKKTPYTSDESLGVSWDTYEWLGVHISRVERGLNYGKYEEWPPSCNKQLFVCCRERQSMTDRTLDLIKALQEAQLQRLEASLSARSATPPVRTDKTIKNKQSLTDC